MAATPHPNRVRRLVVVQLLRKLQSRGRLHIQWLVLVVEPAHQLWPGEIEALFASVGMLPKQEDHRLAIVVVGVLAGWLRHDHHTDGAVVAIRVDRSVTLRFDAECVERGRSMMIGWSLALDHIVDR